MQHLKASAEEIQQLALIGSRPLVSSVSHSVLVTSSRALQGSDVQTGNGQTSSTPDPVMQTKHRLPHGTRFWSGSQPAELRRVSGG